MRLLFNHQSQWGHLKVVQAFESYAHWCMQRAQRYSHPVFMSMGTSSCMKLVNICTSVFKSRHCALLTVFLYSLSCKRSLLSRAFHPYTFSLIYWSVYLLGCYSGKRCEIGPVNSFSQYPGHSYNGCSLILRGSSNQSSIHWKWFFFFFFSCRSQSEIVKCLKTWQKRANREGVQSSLFNRKHTSHLTRSLAVNFHARSSQIDVTIFNDDIF